MSSTQTVSVAIAGVASVGVSDAVSVGAGVSAAAQPDRTSADAAASEPNANRLRLVVFNGSTFQYLNRNQFACNGKLY
jgi:hypothetical protein